MKPTPVLSIERSCTCVSRRNRGDSLVSQGRSYDKEKKSYRGMVVDFKILLIKTARKYIIPE